VQKTFKHNLQLKAGIKDILNDPVRFVQYYGNNDEIIADTRNYIPNRQLSLSLTWTL
jgi:hypothetical protein